MPAPPPKHPPPPPHAQGCLVWRAHVPPAREIGGLRAVRNNPQTAPTHRRLLRVQREVPGPMPFAGRDLVHRDRGGIPDGRIGSASARGARRRPPLNRFAAGAPVDTKAHRRTPFLAGPPLPAQSRRGSAVPQASWGENEISAIEAHGSPFRSLLQSRWISYGRPAGNIRAPTFTSSAAGRASPAVGCGCDGPRSPAAPRRRPEFPWQFPRRAWSRESLSARRGRSGPESPRSGPRLIQVRAPASPLYLFRQTAYWTVRANSGGSVNHGRPSFPASPYLAPPTGLPAAPRACRCAPIREKGCPTTARGGSFPRRSSSVLGGRPPPL